MVGSFQNILHMDDARTASGGAPSNDDLSENSKLVRLSYLSFSTGFVLDASEEVNFAIVLEDLCIVHFGTIAI